MTVVGRLDDLKIFLLTQQSDFPLPCLNLIGSMKLEFLLLFCSQWFFLSGTIGNSSQTGRLYWLIHLYSLQSMCSLEASALSSLNAECPRNTVLTGSA